MKILVCDDDRFARDLMNAMLESLANDVFLADCGEAAISIIEEGGVMPDLILLDVIMPGLNGYETAEKIRPLTADRHVPILFLTSLTSEDTATKCLEYGDDFLTKPVTMEVLHAKLLAHFRFVNLYNEVQEKNKKLTYFYQNTAYEQEIVKDIFDGFMVKNDLSSDAIRCHISPMSTFNGDVLLASKSELGSYYVLVADFTGHGLPAAIGTMPVSQTFFSLTKEGKSLGTIAYELNRMVGEFMPSSMMCAATLLELGASGTRLTIWSGGMPDAFIASREGKVVDRIASHHMPLGALEPSEFNSEIEVKNLELGDKVYLYTDGIIEAKVDDDNMLGEEGVKAIIEEKGDVFERILECAYRHSDSDEQDDDITLVQITAMQQDHASVSTEAEGMMDQFPFHLNISLGQEHLRSLEPIPHIKKMLQAVPGVDKHVDFISTILSEMYSNGLEHGLLNLASIDKDAEDGFETYYYERQKRLLELEEGRIDIDVSLKLDSELPRFVISVSDSGDGFDHEKLNESDDEQAHGRGIGLIDYFCESSQYSEGGTRLEVEYELNSNKLQM